MILIPIRSRVLDAAVELVGTQGLRALTHGRVDERAGVPKGSTSNYFRTRSALLTGVVDHIVQRETVAVQAFTPDSAADLVDAMCGIFAHVTRVDRVQTAARLVVFMEAAHNAEVRAAVSRGRDAVAATVVAALASLGAPDPVAGAAALMACSEGLIMHDIAREDPVDPRPVYRTVVRAALSR